MRARLLSLLSLFSLGAQACDASPSAPLPSRDACALAVIHSDYRSTSVSLITATGAPCAPDILDSGSRPPGLLTALSGDVVLPRAPIPQGLALLDRYPAGVLTVLDPITDRVTHQASLSPGFAGNPQDLLALADGTLLVSRLQRAPSSAGEGGSDLALLRLDAADPDRTVGGTLLARIDLDALAEPGFDPMPVRLAFIGEQIAVGLAHMTGDFTSPGPGRIGLLRTPRPDEDLQAWAADPELRQLALPGLENCTELAPSPDRTGLWVACSGSFRRGAAAQTARSGIAFITTDGEVLALIRAEDLIEGGGLDAPLGFTLAAVDAHRALVVALGDLASARPDRALLVERPPAPSEGAATLPQSVRTVATSDAFNFGDALAVDAGQALLLTDGNPSAPRLLKLNLNDLESPPTHLLTSSRTGLPPRHIGPITP